MNVEHELDQDTYIPNLIIEGADLCVEFRGRNIVASGVDFKARYGAGRAFGIDLVLFAIVIPRCNLAVGWKRASCAQKGQKTCEKA